MLKKVINYTISWKRRLKFMWRYRTFDVTVKPKMWADRMRVCGQCPFLKKGICEKCGCPVKNKARIVTERCPTGDW